MFNAVVDDDAVVVRRRSRRCRPFTVTGPAGVLGPGLVVRLRDPSSAVRRVTLHSPVA